MTTKADERLAPVQTLIGKMVRTERVSGAAVAVVARGQLALEHYEGIAGPGLPAGAETLWPLASITKLYTAAMIVRLIEAGELTLTTRVESILPRMTGDGREKITLRQLLTHTSGIMYESPEMPKLLAAQTPLVEIVDEVYERPLLFAPGSSQSYSDLGYALAGRLAATAMQTDYSELVRELVLEPAGLHDTFLPPRESEFGRIAYVTGPFAEGTPGAMYNSTYARGLAHPAFGVVATLRDLVGFGTLFTAHVKQPIFSKAGLRTAISDQTGSDFAGEIAQPVTGVIHPWGLGVMIKGRTTSPDLVSPDSFGHPGASGCMLWIDPIQDVIVAFVSNRHYNADPDGFFTRIDRVVNVAMACLSR